MLRNHLSAFLFQMFNKQSLCISRIPCYNGARLFFPYGIYEHHLIKEAFILPLIICMTFFAVLFGLEALWFACAAEEKKSELRRYHAVEHPRRMTSDCYLDMLG